MVNRARLICRNLKWLKISNKYGFIPWCGTLFAWCRDKILPTLKPYVDVDSATAQYLMPLTYDRFILRKPANLPDFNAVENIKLCWMSYASHSIPGYLIFLVATLVSFKFSSGYLNLITGVWSSSGIMLPYDRVARLSWVLINCATLQVGKELVGGGKRVMPPNFMQAS